jgi:hypothetical protein
MSDLERKQLEKVIVAREADRARLAAEYAARKPQGLFGPLYVARSDAEAKRLIPAVSEVPNPNWGKDAKGRRVWVGPTDADGNPSPLEGA